MLVLSHERRTRPLFLFFSNLVIALSYFILSHLNFLLFSEIGVLPMPVWPAAGIALVAAFYFDAWAAPGIAVGTFAANFFSLGASLPFASLIMVMNTAGPILGAWIIRNRLSNEFKVRKFGDLLVVSASALLLVPFLTALGGIGFKSVLGMVPSSDFLNQFFKWFLAHLFGTILIAAPLFLWLREKIRYE